MQLELSADARQFIDHLVETGRYTSANDGIAEGVRLLMPQEELKADIQEGVRELDEGMGIDGRQVIAELRARVTSISSAGSRD